MSGYQSSGVASELWLQWFGCCGTQPPSRAKRRPHHAARRTIDRTMIGNPTNFQHTVHIGSGDVQLGNSHLNAIQSHMQSKGGYEQLVKAC